ncbi:Polyketide cyclase / dehydrase and lipid transport [Poseidonocella pacifica]|uniref:Polyketide cyclase / dehydrase and lipid transport n=1 Tax=Poseidonocella pacifica TaxID=871651 RepID=A0A1I0XIS5_9RHOB|nr:SRPBCC family protein [Poseidonocella pacifica]SFB00891.1 Polyketide cyclase / dehydrase and lipid transport [Poseidonocella pacifica]
MKFTASQDISAPIDVVFGRVSDFDFMERLALRRGIDVARHDMSAAPRAGMRWTMGFVLRGRRRKVEVEMVGYEPPHKLRFKAVGEGAEGDLAVDIVALARERTRLALALQVKPRSLNARIAVQALQLSRGRYKRRLLKRLATLASQIEADYIARS